MFNKIARYVRKKRSRVLSQLQAPAISAPELEKQHGVALLVDSETRPNTPDHDHDTVLEKTEQSVPFANTHSPHRPRSPVDCGGSDHLAATQGMDALTHTQEVSMPKQGASAGGETIVDPFALGRLWNSFASINTLPDEVLVQVFLCTRLKRDRWAKDISPVEPTRYMAVCRHWRNVIVSHACFWETIIIKKRTDWLRLALSRSHEAMLHLEFDDLPTLASVFPNVIPHRDRIRSLKLGYHPVYCPIVAVSPLIQGPFVSLATLKIQASAWYRPDSGYFVLLSEHFPQLTRLELTGLHVQWAASLLSHLTTLSLTNGCSIWPSRMDADAFLDVLQHGQYLERLTLNGFISAACSILPSRSRHPFSLARLRDFKITDSAQWVQQFTTFVRLPAECGQVSLTGKADISDLDNAPISLRGLLLPPDVPFFPDTRSLAVHVLGPSDTFILRSSGSPVHMSLQLDLPAGTILSSSTILSSIKGVLHPYSLHSLHLTIPMHNVDRDAFDAYLDASPRLRSLHIGSAVTHQTLPVCVFDSLAARTRALDRDESDVARVRLRCPKLKSLGLKGLDWDGGAVMGAALDCLQIRAALDVPRLAHLYIGVMPRPPAPVGGAHGWRDADARYAAQLQKMVSARFTFSVDGVYSS